MMRNFTAVIVFFFLFSHLKGQPVLVKDLNPGTANGFDEYNYNGIPFNDAYLIPASDGALGSELYELKNGTLTLIKDINPGIGDSDPSQFYASNGKVYFTASATGGQGTLWQTDGTPDGTIEVPALASIGIEELVMDKNGVFYFVWAGKATYFDPATGVSAQLSAGPSGVTFKPDYNSTGAKVCSYGNGIVFVKAGNDIIDFWSVESSNITKIYSMPTAEWFTKVYGLTPVQDGFLFTVSNSSYPDANGLYGYSETSDTATRIVNAASNDGLNPRRIVALNGSIAVFMDATNVYSTDGTANGTVLLHTGAPSLVSGELWKTDVHNDKMLFEGETVSFSVKIYATDGTVAGTTLAATTEDPFISPMYFNNGHVWWASGTSNGFKPVIWHTNMQTLASDKVYTYTTGSPIKSILPITLEGNKLYYLSNMGGVGRELYSITVPQSTGVVNIDHSPYQVIQSNTQFRIELPEGQAEILKAFIYAADGRLVHQLNVPLSENVAFPEVASGVYLVVVQGKAGKLAFQHVLVR